jgi:L-fucose isomerase-like protein
MSRKPKAVMVPFGYPGYPGDLVDRLQKESEDMLRAQDIDVVTVPRVTVWADAKKTAAELRKHECDFVVVLILSWLEALNVIETVQEQFNKPILLWSHTMFEQDGEKLNIGAVAGVGVIREAFEEFGLRFRFVWGMPNEERVQQQVKSAASVLSTISRLRHSKIGLVGYGSMGMYTAFFDHTSLKRDLGPEVEQLDQYALVKKIEETAADKVAGEMKTAKAEWEIGEAVTDPDLEITFKMYHCLKEIVKEFDWQALTVKCQYELSKIYKHVPCVPLSMLGNDMPCSCEGDVPLITTQLIMHYISGGATVTYCDIHDMEQEDIMCAACGYAPLNMGEGRPKVDKTELLYEGVANCTIYREGQVTVARLAYTKDRTYKMHITGGKAHHAKPFREVGCLPYPSMAVTLDGSTEHFGQHMMSQHYAIMYGDIRRELVTFCDLMGIRPVCS